MSLASLKALRWPLAGLYWTTILLHGLAARYLAEVDVAIARRAPPPPPAPSTPVRSPPSLRVVK